MAEFLWGAEARDEIPKWQRIVKTNPARVVSVLKLVSPDGRNKWGDTRRVRSQIDTCISRSLN